MSENDKHELPKDEKDPALEAALLTIIKRYADFSEKVRKELGLSGGGWNQCSRVYNGKRYRVIVAEYEHCPVEELTRLSRALAGRDPEKLEGLLEAVRMVVTEDSRMEDGQSVHDFRPDIIDLANALAAFEGRGGE